MSHPRPRRIGMLTPSSNTVLEPLTAAMLRDVPQVEAHFARFRVVEISMSQAALGQFDVAPMLEAADLLADAKVDVIVWNGTSAGWLGFARDEALCAAITRRTGIAASSAVLALNDILARTATRRFALVTPYVADIERRIVDNYVALGMECVAARRRDLVENFAFAAMSEAEVAAMCREVDAHEPDATLVYCTNMRGAGLAAQMEAQTGRPLYDTVATALWGALRAVGESPRVVSGWGRVFEVAP